MIVKRSELLRTTELHPVTHSTVRPRRARRTHGRHSAPAAIVWPEVHADLALNPGWIRRLEVSRQPNDELSTESRRSGVAARPDRRAHCSHGVDHESHRHLSTRR